MSELTTEQVKYCATDGYRGIEEDEFDAWLTQHDAEVIAKAEARIIKLLEENYPGRLAGVIALIKEQRGLTSKS